jgi:hypothetical protein
MVPKIVFCTEPLDLVELDVGVLGSGGRCTGDVRSTTRRPWHSGKVGGSGGLG